MLILLLVFASERTSTALELLRQKIADQFVAVPVSEVQETALMGMSLVNPLDFFIIGGVATRCGIALDMATRGLRVGLVEREDFSSRTSPGLDEFKDDDCSQPKF